MFHPSLPACQFPVTPLKPGRGKRSPSRCWNSLTQTVKFKIGRKINLRSGNLFLGTVIHSYYSFYFNNLLTLNKLKAPMRQALHLYGSWSLIFVFVGGAVEPSQFFPHLCEMFHSSGPFLDIDRYIMCRQIMDILQFLIVFVVSVNDTSFWLMTFRPF